MPNSAQYWWSSTSGSSYCIGNSIRFKIEPSSYLETTLGSAPSSTTMTVSFWYKSQGDDPSVNFFRYLYGIGQHAVINQNDGAGVYNTITNVTSVCPNGVNGAFTDPSAWYHVVGQQNNGTYTFWVNGVQWSSQAWPYTPNTNFRVFAWQASNSFDLADRGGYCTEFYFIDGEALEPTAFGEFNNCGVWVPKRYTGAFSSSNSFYLDFSPGSVNYNGTDWIISDQSGNNNDFTAVNVDLDDPTDVNYDYMTDSPTENWATGNPIDVDQNGNSYGAFKANLANYTPAVVLNLFPSTIQIEVDDPRTFIAEIHLTNASQHQCMGVASEFDNLNSYINYSQNGDDKHTTISSDASVNITGNYQDGWRLQDGSQNWGNTYVQVVYDNATRRLKFYDNGQEIVYTAAVQATPQYNSDDNSFDIPLEWGSIRYVFGNIPTYYDAKPEVGFNYLQQPLQYPIGDAVPLTAKNLQPAVITNGTEGFRALTGPGADILSIAQGTGNGTGIQGWGPTTGFPDGLWWIANSENYQHWQMVDSVNGITDVMWQNVGTSGNTYFVPNADAIAWCWKNDPKYGFDITATNGTHDLGVVPAMVIDRAGNLTHQSLQSGYGLNINTDAAAANQNWVVTDTTVTGPGGGTYYAWAEIPGYSAFGSYTGTNNADGPFLYFGFRPAYVLIKCSTSGGGDWHWLCWNTTSPNNQMNPCRSFYASNYQTPDEDYQTTVDVDIVSNGFKIRNTNFALNTANATFIYAAFAEHPFGGCNVAPVVAR